MFQSADTIVAPATATGGALSIIRISGADALGICDRCFRSPSGKHLSQQTGYTVHFGNIVSSDGAFIDEVLATVFRSPASYTGENMVEISCHGSRWIVSEIIRTLTQQGARLAEAGEFTVRAFLAGKLDLAQAEAVADMIASENKASHTLASTQLRGKYSAELTSLRGELLRLASLIELELDFSEEDVNFADRTELAAVITRTQNAIESLASSFALGNAIKEGIGVAIIGKPNAGKSTLLNTLLGEDRAMVSDIAGTTRDIIEEHFNIDGIGFRLIDTAGIRHSNDILEKMGIERTYKAVSEAKIILYIVDANTTEITTSEIEDTISQLMLTADQQFSVIINKCDSLQAENEAIGSFGSLPCPTIPISAKYNRNLKALTELLTSSVDASTLYGEQNIVTNARHYDSLRAASASLHASLEGLNAGIPSDLLAEDLRHALDHIGAITGEITSADILSEIFSKFCIGK